MENVNYDSSQIEQWGVDAVGVTLSHTDTLRRYFKENDKTPLWDGTVIIYKSKKKSKQNILGFVTIQLKGKLDTEEELKKENISYAVEINDLIKYKENSGTIYFVTLINKHNAFQKETFYETLTPRKIRNYIKGKEQQETCTIKLNRLPQSKHEIQSIFYNFYKESSIGDVEPISLVELPSLNENVKITGSLSQFLPEGEKTSLIDVLLKNELLWTAKFSNHPTPRPIDFGSEMVLSIIFKEGLLPILVNGEKYDNYYSITRNKNGTVYTFGKSTTLEIHKNLKGINLKFHPSNFLSDRIKDYNFFINLIETNEIKIEGQKPFVLGDIKSDKPFELDLAKKELDFYKRIDEFWRSLKVSDDFDIGNIDSNSSLKELDILIESINGKKTLKIATLGKEQFYLLKIDISNFKILFFLEAIDQEKCLYKIYNYFDYKNNFYDLVDDSPVFTSKYTFLKSDDFIELSNIDFSDILHSYKEFHQLNKRVLELANLCLLELLLAYDKHENHLSLILETAQEISDWLLAEGDDVVPYDIKVVNYLQTIKRQRKLSDEENRMLYAISEKSNKLMFKIAANLLLENYKVAQIQFDQLSDEDKKSFKSFPIYSFWLNR